MISAIITAAGKNRRMEEDQKRLGLEVQNKLLLDLNGKPVIIRTMEHVANTSAQEYVVVLGHFSIQIESVLEGYQGNKVRVVSNSKKDVELSETLLNGVNQVKEGLCLCVAADQPTVSGETLQNLIDAALEHEDAENIVSVLARKGEGRLDTAEGLGMPFVCHSSLLKNYLPHKNDNLNPILINMINDGVAFYGVPTCDELELININHWQDYLTVREKF